MKRNRILVESILFFSAFFLPGYLTQGRMSPQGADATLMMLEAIIAGLPQFLLMIYVVGLAPETPYAQWGLVSLQGRDLPKIALLVIGSLAGVLFFTLLVSLLPPEWSGILARGERWGLEKAGQIPLALAFGLATGYREEFFYRSYLLTRFDQLGIPVPLAVAASTALFTLGHLYEGFLGLALASVLGILFAVVFLKYRNLHLIAIGHGLYNTAVLCLGLFDRTVLPNLFGMDGTP